MLVKKVLIVDDNREFCESLKDIIEMEGHTVLTAYGGQSALKRLKKEPVDLVLMDLVMPGMDGVATIKAIREIPLTVPIVIVSAYSEETLVNEALRCGAKGKLGKPIHHEALLAELNSTPAD
jgi:CheY-like chemotaxis protein